jgi:hypothetical protein
MTRIEYFSKHTTNSGGCYSIEYKCLLSGKTFYWEDATKHIYELNKTGKYELIK